MNYAKELYGFFERLDANNSREWFKAHRREYDELRAAWMADLDRLILLMTQWEPGLAGQTAANCSYRIYRDTRFSADKSPLKTYFSAAISPWGRKSHRAGYYIQMGPDLDKGYIDSGLFGGIWQPDAAMLRKLRRAIVDNIEEFEELLSAPAMVANWPGWCGEALKTVPKGYDRNHPQAQYLRLKDYGKFYPTTLEFYTDPCWPERASELMSQLKPLMDFFNYSLDEEV